MTRRPSRSGRGRGRSAGADAARRARRDRGCGGRHGRAWPVRSRRRSCRPAKVWRRPPHKGCPDSRRRRPTDAELSKTAGGLEPRRARQSQGGRRSGRRRRCGDTHPAGRWDRPSPRRPSHTPPTVPAGARPSDRRPRPRAAAQWAGMPMGMPMGGMMRHGQGGDARRRQGARGQEGRHAAAAAHRAGDREGSPTAPRPPRRRLAPAPTPTTPTTIRRRADRCCGESRWRR